MSTYDDDYDGAGEQATQEADQEEDVDDALAAAMDEEMYDDDDDDEDTLAGPTAPKVQEATYIGQQPAGDDAGDDEGDGDGDGQVDEEQLMAGVGTGALRPRQGAEENYLDDMADGADLLEEGDGEAAPEEVIAAPAEPEPTTATTAAQAEAERQRKLLQSMTEEQLDRYEAYRRSALPRAKIKKVARAVGLDPTPEALIALGAIGKLFVGEVVELARKVANGQGHSGALLASHVHTAYQLLHQRQKVPQPVGPKRLFKRL